MEYGIHGDILVSTNKDMEDLMEFSVLLRKG